MGELVMLFKSHVMSLIEYRTPAIVHAASSALSPVDAILTKFLPAVDLSSIGALLQFCLALALRRDIAILGVMHRVPWVRGPSCCSEFSKVSRCLRLLARHAVTFVTCATRAACAGPTTPCILRLAQFGCITCSPILLSAQ